jgi:hypothetical protein
LTKTETVETTPPVADETRLAEIQQRRRIAEAAFNNACVNVSKHRELLARANSSMEKARRAFHAAEEEEAAELMRVGLRR